MTAPDTTGSVHWTQDGLEALVEGKDGHGDTCAPIVMLSYRNVAHHVPLDDITLDASRTELIAWGLMDTPGEPGMTVAAVATALRDRYSSPPVKTVDYNAALDLEAFHSDLKAAMLAHQAVVMETSDASALPGNQAGVQYHFVLLWGIDSVDGYYCANGDLEAGITGVIATIPPVWYTWDDLAASKPVGYVILPAVDPVAPPPPPPPPPPSSSATTHVIASGDTLPDLAMHYYGTAEEWGVLWTANQELIPNPFVLPIGKTIIIPAL